MCSPIIFTCHTCARKHNYKLNPCRRARGSTAGLPPGTPIHPFICQNAVLAEFRVACDACKERWKATQREVRRREEDREKAERRRRESSVAFAAVVGKGMGMRAGGMLDAEGWGRRATVAEAGAGEGVGVGALGAGAASAGFGGAVGEPPVRTVRPSELVLRPGLE